jgi:PhnB protein
MLINTYLVFSGRCEEAFDFYANVLGGKIVAKVPHAGTPAEGHVPEEWKSKLMHAHLTVGDQVLMGSDAPPDRYEAPKGFSVSLQIDDSADGQRVFNALAEGGMVRMPFQETFWARGFGMLVDRFGIPWMINCMKPM